MFKEIQKKILATLMTLAMVVSLMPVVTLPAKAAVWGGDIGTTFAGGDGSLGAPYQIATGEQLAYMADRVNNDNANYANKYYLLTADIDLNHKPWTPIGVSISFSGTFDGGGHTISNLTINSSTYTRGGLFGNTLNVTLKNIYIKDASINISTAAPRAGLLAGQVGSSGTVYNCGASGTLVCTDTTSTNQRAGGLIGYAVSLVINNCYSTANCSGSSSGAKVGGLIGEAVTALNISNCFAAGNMVSGNTYVGGVIGYYTSDTTTSSSVYWNSDATHTANEATPSTKVAVGDVGIGSGINNESKTSAYMQSADFVTLLNTNKGTYSSWAAGSDGYPTFAPPNAAPTVTTASITTYGSTTATLGGEVTADGGETVTESGIVYSTTDDTPTIAEGATKVSIGTGTGNFSQSVTGLSPNTTYYVNAYAINSVGTSYGTETSFMTAAITASISATPALTEENLNTNSLTVTLSGTTFADDTLDASNFTLNNAPSGVSIAGVTHNSATGCTITLAYSGTDFDSSVTDFSLTIAAAELASSSALTSNALTITAIVEAAPTATIVVANTALKAGETSLVTITFSAPASDFTNDDLTIENGTLSTVSSSDGGITWTATFTPTADITDTSNKITLANTGIADAEGNFGTGTTDSNNYAIDTQRPTAAIVVANNALKAGETSLVTITFSEAVTGFTNADFTAIGNGTLSTVSSSDGGTTWTATFTPAANITDTSNVITLDNTGIADAAGNSGTGTTSSNNYAIDTQRPTAAIVVANNALKAGETSSVTITFSEAVTGFTNADFTAIGNGTLSSVSSSDGGITFTATFTPTADTAEANNVITLNNTGIADEAGNSGTGTTNSNNYAIDTLRPTITGGTLPLDGTYITGQNLDFTVNFSEAVSINTDSGTPYLTLTVGSTAVHANYLSGSGSALVFRYTVASGDADANGIALSSNITLNGGTIRDAAGNDATVTYTGTTLTNVLVDAVAPTVSSVTGPVAGTYTAGDNLNFTATFSEAVTVTDTPYIQLTIGSSTVNAAYVSGTETTSLTFQYTIASGNADADGIACISPIVLPAGAAIKDVAGNDANLAFTPPTTSAVLVDALAPTISSAAIVSGNSYIDIVFSEGIYGASGGATSLTAAKLALTFTQNSGSATNVTISSIKKNDNTAEASASALTGGETTVRVFLSVTGTPSGAETIEIRPADASSIYDFIGNSMASTETTGTKTLIAPVSYGGDTGSTTNNGTAVVEVNGEKQDAGQTNTQTTGGTTTTTITVDYTKLNNILEQKGNNATVTLLASGNPNVVVGQLTGQTVKNMETKEAILEIKTETVTYTLPASQINIDAVSSQLGAQVELKDIKVSVRIAEPPADTVKIVENTASKGNYQLVVKPVEFQITCTSGDTTVEVSRFNGYVERTIAIPDGIDPSKITTGIVLNSDGTFSHVPTSIVVINGKYFAKINSLTNSTYSVIYNPVTFTDVSSHWAKDAVNDMGSRMVVTGIGNGIYEPERSITRAEFAAIVVRAMGLKKGTTESAFSDVTLTDWFNGYVDTATAYSLITGYDNASFAPNDTITREQAMTILARAMKLTGLSVTLTDSEASALLANYTDAGLVSYYAKTGAAVCIKTGVVSGTTASTLSPKDSVTRAEVAAMVQRLLKKSGLI